MYFSKSDVSICGPHASPSLRINTFWAVTIAGVRLHAFLASLTLRPSAEVGGVLVL
jgi:hypothetical protein